STSGTSAVRRFCRAARASSAWRSSCSPCSSSAPPESLAGASSMLAGSVAYSRGARPPPNESLRRPDPHEVEHAAHRVVDELVDGRRPRVEPGNGRRDDGAHLCELGERAQVAEVERRLAYREDEAAFLLQRHAGG